MNHMTTGLIWAKFKSGNWDPGLNTRLSGTSGSNSWNLVLTLNFSKYVFIYNLSCISVTTSRWDTEIHIISKHSVVTLAAVGSLQIFAVGIFRTLPEGTFVDVLTFSLVFVRFISLLTLFSVKSNSFAIYRLRSLCGR